MVLLRASWLQGAACAGQRRREPPTVSRTRPRTGRARRAGIEGQPRPREAVLPRAGSTARGR
eukprot:9358085-Pyramimonas_sp.AAC.1